MKKGLILCIIILIIFLTIFKLQIQNPNIAQDYYVKDVTVIEIDPSQHVITVCDKDNELWSFYSSSNWYLNNNYKCIMNNEQTQTIYDDSIVMIY